MKKSLVAVMLGLIMAVAMTGCGGCGTEETTEVVTEVMEEDTEVVADEPTEIETEVTEEPAEEENPVSEEISPYTYTELNLVMYAHSTVNVRDLPEQTGKKIGSLTTNQEVTVIGQCNETGWYRINYNDSEGFVSNSYLGNEKVSQQESSTTDTTSSSNGNSSDWIWYMGDDGELYVNIYGNVSRVTLPVWMTKEDAISRFSANHDDWCLTYDESELFYQGSIPSDIPYSPEEAAADNTLTPDNWMCTWCNVDCVTYEGFIEHMKSVHNMQ